MSGSAAAMIEDPSKEIFSSWASAWEMAIKISLGKLILGQSLDQFLSEQLDQNGIHLLPMSLASIRQVSSLPFHHRDPFDRLMICHCLEEEFPIVSADTLFDLYGVQRIW